MKYGCINCFKLLSTKQRFNIFEFLKKRGKLKTTISDLVKLTKLRQPTVTFHVNKLAKKGIVKKINFKEGDLVDTGQEIMEIDFQVENEKT